MSRKSVPPHERVLRRVDTKDPERCWRYQGALGPNGYGTTTRTSRRADGMAYVHRIVFEALVGPIPEGLVIDHLCRVRNCVNPAHLEPVTAWENLRRGVNEIGKNPSKTHCPRGHAYDAINTYHYKGARQCRTCRDVHRAAWRARSKESDRVVSRQPLHAEGGAGHA